MSAQPNAASPISPDLLVILACPKCKGPVRVTADAKGLACDACKLHFRVDDGIPIMLVDEARPLEG